uniref:Immunoglobulin V-set domain-containing protein n=1 Tax=Anabas testudineus TaxID=64144 RepID=A0A7N6B7V3_ANATE
IAVTPVFVQKGNDVLLDVIKADVPEDFILFWNFNGSDVLVRYSPGGKRTVSDLYSGRVEFSVKSYSVELKNLQNTDSGVYTAKVIASQEKKVAEYIVTVQVSPVSLTVDSVSSSSDSCNITVTCRTQDSNISSTFRCVNQICEDKREKSKTTTSGTFLHVNLVNDSIICNHSNQVSWTTNTGPSKIQDFCQHDGKNERQDNQLMYSLDCSSLKRSGVNGIVSQDQNQNPVTSTYALVEFHNGPEIINTTNVSPPETIYAQVKQLQSPSPPKSPQNQHLDL